MTESPRKNQPVTPKPNRPSRTHRASLKITATTPLFTLSLHDALPISSFEPSTDLTSPTDPRKPNPTNHANLTSLMNPGTKTSHEHTTHLQLRHHRVSLLPQTSRTPDEPRESTRTTRSHD